MAFEDDVMDMSFGTILDLSAAQYRFVKLSGDNMVVLCNSVGDTPIGVLQNKPVGSATTPGVARVRIMGISRVVAGGAVICGDKLGTDGNGAGVAKTANTAVYMGVVTDGVGSGETITALIMGVPNTISTT